MEKAQLFTTLIEPETVTSNKQIVPNGASEIWFENIGTVDAALLGNIPLGVGSPVRKFAFSEKCEIKTNFTVNFLTTARPGALLVTRVYHHPFCCEACNKRRS